MTNLPCYLCSRQNICNFKCSNYCQLNQIDVDQIDMEYIEFLRTEIPELEKETE